MALLYGPSYNSPLDKDKPYVDGTPVYTKSKSKGKYVVTDSRKESIPNYDAQVLYNFSQNVDSESDHIKHIKNGESNRYAYRIYR